ncbi:hypothetical protein B484DRAFT_458111 [Ochromonadaceae sp. CCMP2298]|jgi:hypothetical protein|nr:hypothetical protein B484DRAFT_458111 [Ochromonadaceae sp. CCMP2298]
MGQSAVLWHVRHLLVIAGTPSNVLDALSCALLGGGQNEGGFQKCAKNDTFRLSWGETPQTASKWRKEWYTLNAACFGSKWFF